MKRRLGIAIAFLALAGCGEEVGQVQDFALPMAVSNNAVTLALGPQGPTAYSFMGLGPGKTPADITRAAFACVLAARRCQAIAAVPVPQGRLAATAVTVGETILIFGGYGIAADGRETSMPEVLAFDPKTTRYSRRAPMPTPVDDSLAAVYADRYVYLVSGWHDTDNVALVQVYDASEDRWFAATDYPGTPVFGHAGGIVENWLVSADGVALGKAEGEQEARRFAMVSEAWIGEIDPQDPRHIRWQAIEPHPGAPLYRAAAKASAHRQQVIFAGGSETPYNYDGIGYDGTPAAPSARVLAFDIRHGAWLRLADKPAATMDHRGLVEAHDHFWTLGGMESGQRVTAAVHGFAAQDPPTAVAP
ncbi:MAG: Kelch repeat-containing protein [Pseudomonadota bacterium]